MYGISKDDDFSFLVGREVLQVCLGQYQTIIALDGANISIECRHTLLVGEGERHEICLGKWPTDGILARLVGQTLQGVSVEDPDILVLTFSGRDVLSLFGHNPHYESFQILCGDKDILV